MRHILILVLMVAVSNTIFSQVTTTSTTMLGNQTQVRVQTTSYGSTQNGLLYLPDTYSTDTVKYPLIIFLHGYGEIGSSQTDLKKLLSQGLPKVIAAGINKIEAINPVDKKLYKFIVFSPQHHGWTTPPENIDFMLKRIISAYRVDTNRVYLTGLSAGGQGVMQTVLYSQTLTNKFAAIVPMSPSAPEDRILKNFSFFTGAKTDAWFFSGSNDAGNYTANAKRYNDSINKYLPGRSRVTLYPGSHCCWDEYYKTTYRDLETGFNIYEWMLTKTVGDRVVAPPDKVPVKYIQLFHDPAKVKKIIVLDVDGKWTEYTDSTITTGEIEIEIN